MDMAVNTLVTPVQSANEKYRVLSGDAAADGDRAAGVWRLAGLQSQVGPELDRARYGWFYLKNPQGIAKVSFLEQESAGAPIGFLGVVPRIFSQGPKAICTGVLVDFVVDPGHRSLGPALKLQREGRAEAMRELNALYGLPAPQAVAICKRLGYQSLLEMTRFARVIRSIGYLRRHIPVWLATPLAAMSDAADRLWIAMRLAGRGVRGEWTSSFDPRFDRLWSRRRMTGEVMGQRDSRFLQWRFGEQPGHEYRTFVVRRPAGDDLAMYFVCEKLGSVLIVKDFLHDCAERHLTLGLLALAGEARKMGMSTLALEVTADDKLRACLRRAQFSARSTRPVFWMIKETLRDGLAGARYYMTPADEDI